MYQRSDTARSACTTTLSQHRSAARAIGGFKAAVKLNETGRERIGVAAAHPGRTCGTTRNGKFLLRRKSRRDRMRAKLREIKEELRRRMHRPIPETGKWLAQVVSGFQAYHAVPTNSAAIGAFRYRIIGLWHRVLCRRSQKGRLVWQRMTKLADEFLPKPHVLHPWPSARFAVRHPR